MAREMKDSGVAWIGEIPVVDTHFLTILKFNFEKIK